MSRSRRRLWKRKKTPPSNSPFPRSNSSKQIKRISTVSHRCSGGVLGPHARPTPVLHALHRVNLEAWTCRRRRRPVPFGGEPSRVESLLRCVLRLRVCIFGDGIRGIPLEILQNLRNVLVLFIQMLNQHLTIATNLRSSTTSPLSLPGVGPSLSSVSCVSVWRHTRNPGEPKREKYIDPQMDYTETHEHGSGPKSLPRVSTSMFVSPSAHVEPQALVWCLLSHTNQLDSALDSNSSPPLRRHTNW